MASWLVDPSRVEAAHRCFRQASPPWPPLFRSIAAPHPDQKSARWHRLGECVAQYMSLSASGAWAEIIRYLSIRDADFARQQRRNLWSMEVQETEIADLSTFEKWDQCGLDPSIPVGPHAASQDVAAELRAARYRGLLSPSAALPDAVNLTLFGERYELTDAVWRPRANPDPAIWLPCELVADRASPPVDLISETCFLGAPHRAYREHMAAAGKPVAGAAGP